VLQETVSLGAGEGIYQDPPQLSYLISIISIKALYARKAYTSILRASPDLGSKDDFP
jgi:hypothetical protein